MKKGYGRQQTEKYQPQGIPEGSDIDWGCP